MWMDTESKARNREVSRAWLEQRERWRVMVHEQDPDMKLVETPESTGRLEKKTRAQKLSKSWGLMRECVAFIKENS